MKKLTVKGPNLLNVSSMFSVKGFGSHVNLNCYCFFCRRVSGVTDTTGIPEETCQTEDDIEKEVVSGGENQIIDNVVNKKFVLDPANPGKDSVHRKRFLYSVEELHFLRQYLRENSGNISASYLCFYSFFVFGRFIVGNVHEGNLPGLMFKKLNKRKNCLIWMMRKKLVKPQGLLVFFSFVRFNYRLCCRL